LNSLSSKLRSIHWQFDAKFFKAKGHPGLNSESVDPT
jgi:hypothetical protein